MSLLDTVHLHVSETRDLFGGTVGVKFHFLIPETEENKNPHPLAIQQFPGYRVVGHLQIVVDSATAAGIQRGAKFVLQSKPETP